MRSCAPAWLDELDRETTQARERALEAIATVETAASEITGAAGAAAWIRSALEDGRWDRRAPAMLEATVAQSSRRVTANSEPLRVPEIVGYLREAVEAPTPIATPHVA
jgi:hypothetical protein